MVWQERWVVSWKNCMVSQFLQKWSIVSRKSLNLLTNHPLPSLLHRFTVWLLSWCSWQEIPFFLSADSFPVKPSSSISMLNVRHFCLKNNLLSVSTRTIYIQVLHLFLPRVFLPKRFSYSSLASSPDITKQMWGSYWGLFERLEDYLGFALDWISLLKLMSW